MYKIALIFILICSALNSFAQHQFSTDEYPVFIDRADSAMYALVSYKIRNSINNNDTTDNLDTLFSRSRVLRAKSVGIKRAYRATPGFTPFDQLSSTNRDTVRRLAISGPHIKRFPSMILTCKNLQALEFVNTRIKKFPRKLKDLRQLQSIYVLNNTHSGHLKLGASSSVKKVGIRGDNPLALPKSYRGYTSLEALDLASNSLTAFPKGTSLKTLKVLAVSNNQLTLKGDKIKIHASLENLDMVRNQIVHVPSSIQNFPNLKRLTLNNNAIETVDAAISKLSRLEQLSFYRNNLKTIPEGLYELPALTEIDLYYNEIERLDKKVANWKKLQILYLANNKLVSVPAELGQLSTLTELYLHSNRISSLPESLGSLAKLRVLRLNNNYLLELPATLSNISGLENLDLSNNQIHQLPSSFYATESLRILVLKANPWDDETKSALGHMAERLRSRQAIVHLDGNALP